MDPTYSFLCKWVPVWKACYVCVCVCVDDDDSDLIQMRILCIKFEHTVTFIDCGKYDKVI